MIETARDDIDGYVLVGSKTQSLTLQSDPDANVITFYYEVEPAPPYKYTVRYIDNETGEDIGPEIPGSGAAGSTITIEVPYVEGYMFWCVSKDGEYDYDAYDPDSGTVTFELTKDGQVVELLYYSY